MNEVLSMSALESKFPAEWVLLEDIQINEAHEIQAGRVICHSKDREEVDRSAVALKPKWFAVLFAGSPSEGMEFLL